MIKKTRRVKNSAQARNLNREIKRDMKKQFDRVLKGQRPQKIEYDVKF